jgi:hypothetical protein
LEAVSPGSRRGLLAGSGILSLMKDERRPIKMNHGLPEAGSQ